MSKPDCSTCGGACCKSVNIQLSDIPAKLREYIETRGTFENGVWRIPSVCKWLKDGRCSNYDNRPAMCREYEVGGSGCLAARKMFNK